MRKLVFGLGMLAFCFMAVRAITVNPASNATADSEATGLTITYRDANGDAKYNRLALTAGITSPDAQTIAATDTIAADACGGIKRITAASAVTTNTTNTFTAPAATNLGCVMTVVNVGANAITLDVNANFVNTSNSNIVMGSSDVVIVASLGASLYWVEVSSRNN